MQKAKNVSVHGSDKPTAKSPVEPGTPGGPTRSVLPVHDESDRGRKPVLQDELAVVASISTYPRERLLKNDPAHPRQLLGRTSGRISNRIFIFVLTSLFPTAISSYANAQTISGLTKVGQLTGNHVEIDGFSNNYNQRACINQKVYGTDLGSSYSIGHEKVRFLFGDTFYESDGKRYFTAPNIIASTSDIDASNGITGINFLSDHTRKAKQFIGDFGGGSNGPYPITGWQVDGVEMIWAVKTDSGFKKIEDAKIFYSADGWNSSKQSTALLPRDKGYPNDFDLVSAWSGQDGYIYFSGIGRNRPSSVKLMRISQRDSVKWVQAGEQVYPEVLTLKRGWKSINDPKKYILKGAFNCGQGEGSVRWIGGNINKYMALYRDRYGKGPLQVRFAATPVGFWSKPINIGIDTALCGDFKDVYSPNLLPEIYFSGTGDSVTVYFLISRMSPTDSAVYNECSNRYSCSRGIELPSPPDCHKVYNTFLMKMTVNR